MRRPEAGPVDAAPASLRGPSGAGLARRTVPLGGRIRPRQKECIMTPGARIAAAAALLDPAETSLVTGPAEYN